MEHTTVRLGKIGETAIIHDIVKNYDYPIYQPIVDDVGVDLVVDRGDKFFKLQVKTIANPKKETSVEVRLRKYDKKILRKNFFTREERLSTIFCSLSHICKG